jgi:hypothetical protein
MSAAVKHAATFLYELTWSELPRTLFCDAPPQDSFLGDLCGFLCMAPFVGAKVIIQ